RANSPGPGGRLCRREDMKLFLKGDRCYTDKCGYERRAYAPGQHGQARRRKLSNYGSPLREKQMVKLIYAVAERQFRANYHKPIRMKGVAGENLLQLLERRLDNVIYRLGFASDQWRARQLVRNGHFRVNGQKVDIPSFLCRSNDQIEVKEPSKKVTRILESLGAVARRVVPNCLKRDKDTFKGKLTQLPARDDLTMPIREQLIVELYSR